mmetsp:Transcript_56539/g.183792  ORF Transcript_56539/g.183792 Transcript_56539/m.183792 type:complete len:256 (-) Transcript_56539:416-1183(-)
MSALASSNRARTSARPKRAATWAGPRPSRRLACTPLACGSSSSTQARWPAPAAQSSALAPLWSSSGKSKGRQPSASIEASKATSPSRAASRNGSCTFEAASSPLPSMLPRRLDTSAGARPAALRFENTPCLAARSETSWCHSRTASSKSPCSRIAASRPSTCTMSRWCRRPGPKLNLRIEVLGQRGQQTQPEHTALPAGWRIALDVSTPTAQRVHRSMHSRTSPEGRQQERASMRMRSPTQTSRFPTGYSCGEPA